MAIDEAKKADILRYYYVERWRVNTIATQLGIHHNTVKRALAQAGIERTQLSRRGSMIDPFLPFILQTLEKFPKLTASRLYDMVKTRGYPGSEHHFRHLIALHRPRPPAEAYLRLRTLPGEQAQVDWGHFGHLHIGRAKRALMAFVMVLSWSRRIFLRFYPNQQTANFIRGHVSAFEQWQGCPRVLLYDNLKSAVLERHGEAIRFNPQLLALAAHYRFEPRPVAVARGNEKGRVERAIRTIRDQFFAARQWQDLDDLNHQAQQWCDQWSASRPCPEEPKRTIDHAFAEEQSQLIALPQTPYPTEEQVEVKVGKTPYARFDLNDYSIPHTQVRRTLVVRASETQLRILDGDQVIATHPRSYDKGQQIENPAHIQALVQAKQRSRHHRSQDRLYHVLPNSQTFLSRAAQRGYPLKEVVKQLLTLLDEYGVEELQAAVEEALAKQVPHPNAVRQSLERRRQQRQLPPLTSTPVSTDPRLQHLTVTPHPLASYDSLNTEHDDD